MGRGEVVKVALFKHIKCNFDMTWPAESNPDGYVRISEPLECDFVMLPPVDLVAAQIAELNKLEQEARAEFQQTLNEFARRKAELLAITYQPEVA